MIDSDLGRSGDGRERSGFEPLLGASCNGEVYILLSSSAADWLVTVATGTSCRSIAD